MIPILDWIFEGIVNWIASIASTILDAVSGLFLEALGTDMTAMEEYFPFITKAYGTLQYTSWAILYLIVLWQIFRAFGGPITEAENPWHLVIRGAIYGLLIGYAKNIAMFCLEIARIPYTSLLDISMTGEDFTFAGVEEVLTNGLTTIVAASTVAGLILVLILLIALGWNYFKLLLETVERYIVVGVLCYTSPLAFSMGGSKTTNNVFKSWCRMVGSQLLLLVMNVWFLRGFASSMGHFIGNGGALTTGKGSIFLWMFCALAYLRCAQRFDSYLSSLGLNVAQTGSSMAMEMMMAARVVSGMGGGAKSAGSVFGGKTGSTATGTGAAASGFAAGFASKFSPNSYVRDAVVEGGSNIGFGGGAGFMGRAFGGMAARNGATLNGDSISSVASRAPGVSGSIGGEIADRSLSNYMPHMQGFQMKGTQISGGHISTTATTPDGKTASVDLYSASQFEKPEVPHSVVTASDGSQWYQMASGEGRGAFYDAPVFGGVSSDSVQEAAAAMEDQAVASSIGAEVEAIQQGMGAYPGTGMPDSSGEEVAMPGGDAPAFGTQFVQGAEGELPGGMTLDGTQEMQQGMPVLSQDAVTGETLTESAGEAQPFGAASLEVQKLLARQSQKRGQIFPCPCLFLIRAILELLVPRIFSRMRLLVQGSFPVRILSLLLYLTTNLRICLDLCLHSRAESLVLLQASPKAFSRKVSRILVLPEISNLCPWLQWRSSPERILPWVCLFSMASPVLCPLRQCSMNRMVLKCPHSFPLLLAQAIISSRMHLKVMSILIMLLIRRCPCPEVPEARIIIILQVMNPLASTRPILVVLAFLPARVVLIRMKISLGKALVLLIPKHLWLLQHSPTRRRGLCSVPLAKA